METIKDRDFHYRILVEEEKSNKNNSRSASPK